MNQQTQLTPARRSARVLTVVALLAGLLTTMVGGLAAPSAAGAAPAPGDGTGVPLAQRFSGGARHFCVVTDDAEVYCYGDNRMYQTGPFLPGASYDYGIRAPLDRPAIAVAAGENHTCVLTDWLVAQCFGDSRYGQTGSYVTERQIQTPDYGNIQALAAGSEHTCFLELDGTARCIGNNRYGQLGVSEDAGINKAHAYTHYRVGVVGLTAITAGSNHNCAIPCRGGVVYCWGSNSLGQLGSGSAGGYDYIPRSVRLPRPATAISAGDAHTCATVTDGTVWCWGSNRLGQLGAYVSGYSVTPVQVGGVGGTATDISVDGDFSCSTLADTTVRCWGSNSLGQFGSTVELGRATYHPTAFAGYAGVVALATADETTCAVISNGAIYCAGSSEFGQQGSRINPYQPREPHPYLGQVYEIPAVHPSTT